MDKYTYIYISFMQTYSSYRKLSERIEINFSRSFNYQEQSNVEDFRT